MKLKRLRLFCALACLAGSVGFSVAVAVPASASTADIVNLAYANLDKGDCSTNSLGGVGFYASCANHEYWCADFAKWVWANAGVSYASELTAAAASFIQYGIKHGTKSSTPAVGDAVVFDYRPGYAAHVALVVGVGPGTITTISGDWGGQSGYGMHHFADTAHVKSNGTYSSAVGTKPSAMGMTISGYVAPAGFTSGASPSIASLTSSSHELPPSGGAVTLTASAVNATSYSFSVSPALPGFPKTINSTTGSASTSVSLPANSGANASVYTFNVTTSGGSGHDWAATSVTVLAPSPTAPTNQADVLSSFVDAAGNYNVFLNTGGGINHYERSPNGPWGGEVIASGSFVGAPTAFQDQFGDYQVFANSGAGINHYQESSTGGWGGEVVVGGSFVGTPTAFRDSVGDLEVFAVTSGGINHYEKGPNGGWGGEVVATGTFTSAPTAMQDTGGYFNVYVTTSGGINHYRKSPTGSWGGEVVATGSNFRGNPAVLQDRAGNSNVFVTTTGGLNHYVKGTGAWGGEVVATGSNFRGSPAVLQDNAGNYNVYVNTTDGLNHYLKGTGAWGGEVIASYTGFKGSPSAFQDSTGRYNVFDATTGGLNRYTKTTGGWSGEVVATA